MYAIYGNIYHQQKPQMLAYIYIPYMDPMGIDVYLLNVYTRGVLMVSPGVFTTMYLVEPLVGA